MKTLVEIFEGATKEIAEKERREEEKVRKELTSYFIACLDAAECRNVDYWDFNVYNDSKKAVKSIIAKQQFHYFRLSLCCLCFI